MSYLEKIIKNSENNQNASLSIKIRKNPELLKELMELTHFLDHLNSPINVRMKYIKMGAGEIKKCKNCFSFITSININNDFCSNKSCPPSYYNRFKTEDQIGKKSLSISNAYHKKTDINKEKIKKTREKTNIKKYGVVNNLLIPGIKEKIAKGNLEKYGFEIATKNEKIIEKIKKTNLKKYGGNSPMCNELIKNKSKKAIYEKFGLSGAPQGTYKEYIMPSGKILKYLGFENRAFDNLLLEMNEEDFFIAGKDLNKILKPIKYKNPLNMEFRYYPDIYIPKFNKIVEVKSNWTYEINKEINDIKGKACKDLGYDFEFWIYEGKNNRNIIPKIIKM